MASRRTRSTGARLLLGVVAMAAGLGFAHSAAGSVPGGGPAVLRARVADTITPVIAEHLEEGVRRAEREGHEAFLVEIDTPGGLDASMRRIIQAFLGSRVPVVVHVAPSGARAASAGALITLAAHVAAMAPGTAIGAATPVDLQGGDVARKVVNDAAAYAVSIARLRGRNTEFAEEAVREARSVDAEEAARIDVVDLVAGDARSLLRAVDGREVRVAGGRRVVLRTAGAAVVPHDMPALRKALQWLADPNIAFLFLSLGTLAILYEIASPGIGAGGVVGLVMLLLALFGLAVLPVNALGGILMAVAAVLFVAELFTPGLGALAGGGVVALVLGGLFLFRGGVEVDPFVLAPVAAVVGGGALLAARLAVRSRRLATTTGPGGLIGREAVVGRASGASGQVRLEGAWWNARTRGEALRAGETVRVLEVDGLDLVVEREGEAE